MENCQQWDPKRTPKTGSKVPEADKSANKKQDTTSNAQCKSWKMRLKVVNFDKLFLHQFSTKIYQTLENDVKTSKSYQFAKCLENRFSK